MTEIDYSNYFWQGKKVRLRPVSPDDAEESYLESLDSPSRQVLQLGIEMPTSVEKLKEVLAKYANCQDVDGIIVFTIEDLEGKDVGGISWHTRSPKNGTFSFGITMGRAHRGKGYAEDAARILLRYSFHERRFQKCNSACVHTNEPSIRLHRKLGFVEEGLRRRQFFMNGQYYDDLLFGLTREEFEENERARG